MERQYTVTFLIEESKLGSLKNFILNLGGTKLHVEKAGNGKVGAPAKLDTKSFVEEYSKYLRDEVSLNELQQHFPEIVKFVNKYVEYLSSDKELSYFEGDFGITRSNVYLKAKELGLWKKSIYSQQLNKDPQHAKQVVEGYRDLSRLSIPGIDTQSSIQNNPQNSDEFINGSPFNNDAVFEGSVLKGNFESENFFATNDFDDNAKFGMITEEFEMEEQDTFCSSNEEFEMEEQNTYCSSTEEFEMEEQSAVYTDFDSK